MHLKKAFKESIKCGTGEAYLLLLQNPNLAVYKYIKKAILKNQSYDPQCEGDRAEYLMQFIKISPQKKELIKVILKGLKTEKKDTWALVQLFRLATILAKEGNQKAWVAIYNRYHRKVIQYAHWCGESAILELDGIEGLKYIAHIRGRALSKDKEDWEDGSLIEIFQRDNPKIDVLQALKDTAENRPLINVYLNAIQETKKKWATSAAQRKPFDASYQSIKQTIESSRLVIATYNLQKLSKATVQELSNDFEQENRPDIQENYLRIFNRIKFSNSYAFLLNFVKNQKDAWRIELGCKALSFFRNKEIRKFALKQLTSSKSKIAYLPLLTLNYKEKDSKLLTALAQSHKNKEDIHNLIIHFLNIYKKNKTKKCQAPLELIYRKLNCGIHRSSLIQLLWERKVLSKKILKELQFDSDEELRKFYYKIKNKRAKKLS